MFQAICRSCCALFCRVYITIPCEFVQLNHAYCFTDTVAIVFTALMENNVKIIAKLPDIVTWLCGFLAGNEIKFPKALGLIRLYISCGKSLEWRHYECPLIVYWTVCSGADQRKNQSSASLAFARGLHHWWPVNSQHKGPVTRKLLPFDDVIIVISWLMKVSTWLCTL